MSYENVTIDEKEFVFNKLTPENNIDISGYREMLDYACHEPDIKNIGITGGYGSGKSSVINTYFEDPKKCDKSKAVRISLAGFDTGKKCRKKVEVKIVNQLLHSISPDRIPQSKLKKKKEYQLIDVIGVAIALLVAVAPLFELVFMDRFYVLYPMWKLRSIFGFSLILSLVSDVYVIQKLFFYLVSRKKIEKVVVKGGELSFTDIGDKSYFDRYLDEIVYMIKNSDVKYFIFEDLDRLNYKEVFVRLREINWIVNLDNDCGTVKFFYLVRDDIFKANDRTKFFDLIVPIVPVMTTANSYEKLCLDKVGKTVKNDFDTMFLRAVCEFVEDYRLLKNILNEYVIYNEKVGENINRNKLLAVLIYKNVFPKDYNKLIKQKGVMYEFLNMDVKKSDGTYGRLCEITDSNLGVLMKKLGLEKNTYRYRLLRYLIKNEYIDETCLECLSTFVGVKMSTADHKFYLNIFDNEELPYDYKLDNPAIIAEKITDSEFDKSCLLNYDFLEYLVRNDRFANVASVIKQLKESQNYDFLLGYIELKSDLMFAVALIKDWDEVFDDSKRLNDSERNKIAIYLLCALDIDELCNWDEWNSYELRYYFSDKISRIVNEKSINDDWFYEKLKGLGVVFKNLNTENIQLDDVDINTIYRHVCEEGIFEINLANIEKSLELCLGEELRKEHIISNLYRAYDDAVNQKAVTVLMDNISKVGEEILLSDEYDAFDDSDEISVRFLNACESNQSLCREYIRKRIKTFDSIQGIKLKSTKEMIITNNKYSRSFKNAYYIYNSINGNTMSDTLIKYLNSFSAKELRHSRKGLNLFGTFEQALMVCEGLDDEVYEWIVRSSRVKLNIMPIEIGKKKLIILIRNKKIIVTERVLDETFSSIFMEPEIIKAFAVNYWKEYKQFCITKQFPINEEALEDVFKEKSLVEEDPDLLDFISNKTRINPLFVDEVNLKIINNWEDPRMLRDSIPDYEQYSKDVREKLLELCKKYSTRSEFENSPMEILEVVLSENVKKGFDNKNIIKSNMYKKRIGQLERLFEAARMDEYAILCREGEKHEGIQYDEEIVRCIMEQKSLIVSVRDKRR